MPDMSPIEQLRKHLWITLGLAALPVVTIGCGGRQTSGTDEAVGDGIDTDDQDDASGDEAEEAEGSGSGSTSTSTSSTSSTSESDTDTGEPDHLLQPRPPRRFSRLRPAADRHLRLPQLVRARLHARPGSDLRGPVSNRSRRLQRVPGRAFGHLELRLLRTLRDRWSVLFGDRT
jgi:hypothetical protein